MKAAEGPGKGMRRVKPRPGVPDLVVLPGSAHRRAAEGIRRLAARLRARAGDAEGGPACWVVTSPVPGDGKSLVAANLALALQEDGDRDVLLVDADLHRPRLPGLFEGLPPRGLADILAGKARLEECIAEVAGSGLAVLAAGEPRDPPPPLALERVRRLLEVASSRRGAVVFDTPPVGLFADAVRLSTLATGVLLVVRSLATPLSALGEAIEAFEEDRLVGIVLNAARPNPVDRLGGYSAYRYGYPYGHERGGEGGEEP